MMSLAFLSVCDMEVWVRGQQWSQPTPDSTNARIGFVTLVRKFCKICKEVVWGWKTETK